MYDSGYGAVRTRFSAHLEITGPHLRLLPKRKFGGNRDNKHLR